MTWALILQNDALKQKFLGTPSRFLPLPAEENPAVPEGLDRLLAARLLCMAPDSRPAFAATFLRSFAPRLCTELPIEELTSLPWAEAAIPAVSAAGKPQAVFILAAILPDTHKKHITAMGSLDEKAQDALKNALDLAHARTGRFFALVRRCDTALEGPSLGLPVCLAALACAKDGGPAVLATGELAEDGTILPVGGIDIKARLVKNFGADMFIYPAGDAPPQGVPAFAAGTLEEAETLASLPRLAPETWRLLRECLADPLRFWERLRYWGPDFETAFKCLKNNGRLSHSPEELRRFLPEACVWLDERKREGDNDRIAAVLPFFPLDWAQGHARDCEPKDRGPLFRLAQHWIAHNNHRGLDTREWEALSEKCGGEEGEQGWYQHRVRTFGKLHNRYQFDPAPAEILNALEHCESLLKRRKALKTLETIGKIHGFLCQNEAFRKNTEDALRHAGCSRQAFLEAGLFGDASRRDMDEAYIYLDAERLDGAEGAALRCLGMKPEDLPPDPAHGYAHALAARIFRARGKLCPGYEKTARELFRQLKDMMGQPEPASHPWQLWSRNMGALLGDAGFLRFSAELCLKDPDAATLLPMALPGLAALRAFEDARPLEGKAGETLARIRQFCAGGSLDSAHFSELLKCQSGAEALDFFNNPENESRLFPFNYR